MPLSKISVTYYEETDLELGSPYFRLTELLHIVSLRKKYLSFTIQLHGEVLTGIKHNADAGR